MVYFDSFVDWWKELMQKAFIDVTFGVVVQQKNSVAMK